MNRYQRGTVVTIRLAGRQPPPAAKQLVGGAGEWRVRTGDYRIAYEIDDDVLVVLVLTIGHRREVYRKL
jgi:mRNA interferase RelE/StbE